MTGRVDGAVLGLSFDYHDAAAAVVVDGEVVAAAAEERFSRRKHDPSLPDEAMRWALRDAGVGRDDLAAVVFYDKPVTTYERILVTQSRVGPRGLRQLAHAAATWSGSKLWVGYRIERAVRVAGWRMPPLYFSEHHRSHAASAFFPSPFEEAAVLTFDGVGEWATTTIGHGRGSEVSMLAEQRFPDSIGLLYSTVTAHCGFAVNDGEYKVMGLAPFGEPRFADVMRQELVHIGEDGSIRLNGRYFDFQAGRRMGHPRLARLFDGPPRRPGEPLTQREADLARSVQVVLEDAVLAVAHHAHRLTGSRHACLAGGVALNCVANRRLLDDGPFDDIWVQPAAGDDGGALGAALWGWHEVMEQTRGVPTGDAMRGCLLGPGFDDREVADWLTSQEISFRHFESDATLRDHVAARLTEGAVVGWFQGRMEFGPRALGSRSILADPRDPGVVARINSKVKRREGFRPFAPAVLEEDAASWFELGEPLPYMVVTAPVRRDRLVDGPGEDGDRVDADFAARLADVRSQIPACTHVDGSARVQTVDRSRAPALHGLMQAFRQRTGCPVLLNTSFNGPDEPIVATPSDALRCFRETGLDVLVMERCVLEAEEVP